MTPLNDATRAQVDAAEPFASTWLGANAGSGKTRVLTDRVARLLLDGVPPQRVLCLTYTKAAASEMQNRLFKRLGAWAMLDDAALRDSLATLGVTKAEDLDRARTLFARAVETPGGLKIQTIHSFCAALLRQFPLEAGVSPRFRELDDVSQRRLIDDILDQVAEAQPRVLEALARHYSGENFAFLAMSVSGASESFMDNALPDTVSVFGVEPGLTLDDIIAQALRPGDLSFLCSLPEILSRSDKPNDQKLAEKLTALPEQPDARTLDILSDALLYGATAKNPHGAKVDAAPTKAFREGPFAPHAPRFEDIMRQVEAAHDLRLRFDVATKSEVLRAFARAFLPAYAAAKAARGVLDFDDLIAKTRALLQDVDMTWILYRLDGGIDHVLVDEAQDTSPAQWSVIQALTAEMTAGKGAREDVARTLFVVGDKKQSIYSFQGADARGFDTMRDTFHDALDPGQGLRKKELTYSFRSAPAILRAVDHVFTGEAAAGLGDALTHQAFHADMPGRVDLWEVEEPTSADDDPPWYDPIDRLSETSPKVRLAVRVARRIAEMLETGTIQRDNGDIRRITGGDILVLVRGRGALFDAIIRACKTAGLPMAGADRLKIGAELAVRDVLALLSFVALPEDSLSLATALRSPLFGWSEAEIFDLAQSRRDRAHLWQELRDRKADFPETLAKLGELRNRADFLRPYELIELILTRHGGRRALMERLGIEAEDGINELLNQALAYEQVEAPSLTGFVARAQAEDIQIKRQTDTTGGLIRVMTVHGAKGLEAPIVILPDTLRGADRQTDTFLKSPETGPVWNPAEEEAPAILRTLKDDAKAASVEENNRLLYVAMTRAANWLIVAGAGAAPKTCWHSTVEAGLTRAGATRTDDGLYTVLRLENGIWPDDKMPKTPETETESGPVAMPLPTGAAMPPPEPTRILSPSNLGGTKVLPGDPGDHDTEAAKLYGTRIHRLLETLPDIPRDTWPTAAPHILALSTDDTAPLLAEAAATIDAAPDIFAPDILAEVALCAPDPVHGAIIRGTADRIEVTETDVRIIDFKTNTRVPESGAEVPDGILRQMGAYLVAAEHIWPDHKIVLEILWTKSATRMVLEHAIVREAFARTPTS